jgi:hypothetical protein
MTLVLIQLQFLLFLDTDESKSRLPEHEAARCLLSLSMIPSTPLTMTPQSSPQPLPTQQPNNYQTEKSKSQPVQRRVITFTNPPKVEFNMLKHEQYYSDPKKSAIAVKSNTDDCAMPMDLTKKPVKEQVIQTVNKVLTPITGDANLLTTIVSINDKLPTPVNAPTNAIDENQLLHDYLTERALLDSKMKQSQMKSAPPPQNAQFLPISVAVTEPAMKAKYRIFSGKNDTQQQSPKPAAGNAEANFSINNNKSVLSFTKKENMKVEVPSPVIEMKETNEIVEDESKSGMETLAEIAAISVKLDINPDANAKRDTNDHAKSVATEYLKLTQSNVLRKREDSESDQEVLQKPIVTPVAPPTSTQSEIAATVVARNVVVGEDGFKATEFPSFNQHPVAEEGSRWVENN